MRALMISIKMTIVLTILLGIVYPLAMTGVANVLFPGIRRKEVSSSATARWSAPSLMGWPDLRRAAIFSWPAFGGRRQGL